MSVRAIIADDEPLARERVHSFLAGEVDVEIVAECCNGANFLYTRSTRRMYSATVGKLFTS